MEYGRAKEFAAAYQEQEVFSRLSDRTIDQVLQVESSIAAGQDPTQMSPEEARPAMADVRKVLADLRALQQVGGSLEEAYAAALSEGK